jgi:protein ImuB
MRPFAPPARDGQRASGRPAARSEPQASVVAKLATRALRPPVAAEVRLQGGAPRWLRSAVTSGEVVQSAGPWRCTGGWWSPERRFAYDYYDVQTSDGTLVRLRFDHLRGLWQVDAVYD